MKNNLSIILICLILASCSLKQEEAVFTRTLDQLDTPEENEQLGIDLLHYEFLYVLAQEFPNFTPEVFENINWQSCVTVEDKESSFTFILTSDAIKHKRKISKFFQRVVDNQIKHCVIDKAVFENAIQLTLEHFEQLDNHDYDKFWENPSQILKNRMTKDAFIDSIKGRDNIYETSGKRIFYCKQYYENLPNTDDATGFYNICYIFDNNKNLSEELLFHRENDELKIVQYFRRQPF